MEREETERTNRRSARRLREAKLKEAALIEDIDWRNRPGLDKGVMLSLAGCDWIRQRHNIILVGPTGTGKTWLACALAHRACLEGFSSYFTRVPRLFGELALARSDGSYGKTLSRLAKTNVLVFDDWGSPLADAERRDLLEIIEDRNGTASTVITTQVPVDQWHEVIGDPTLADAILDRLIHCAHVINLSGESLRKKRALVAPVKQEG